MSTLCVHNLRMVCADVFLRALLRFSSGAASPRRAFFAPDASRRRPRHRRRDWFALIQVFCTNCDIKTEYGAYGVTVNTGACGALDQGSIPCRHPMEVDVKKTARTATRWIGSPPSISVQNRKS